MPQHFFTPGAMYEAQISDQSDWTRFDALAARLEAVLGGAWQARLDGPDQRYWDLKLDAGVVTLHLEQYLGISLMSTSAELLERAREALTDGGPPSGACR